MAGALLKESPPERFYRTKGDRGAWAMTYDALEPLNARTQVRIHDIEKGTVYEASAGTWREYGLLEHGEVPTIYLPIEYFVKHGVPKTV